MGLKQRKLRDQLNILAKVPEFKQRVFTYRADNWAD